MSSGFGYHLNLQNPMDRPTLKIFNFNGSRISGVQRVQYMKAVFEAFDADIISIQEINIKTAV